MQRSATPFETDWADTGMVAMTCERSERSARRLTIGLVVRQCLYRGVFYWQCLFGGAYCQADDTTPGKPGVVGLWCGR